MVEVAVDIQSGDNGLCSLSDSEGLRIEPVDGGGVSFFLDLPIDSFLLGNEVSEWGVSELSPVLGSGECFAR